MPKKIYGNIIVTDFGKAINPVKTGFFLTLMGIIF